MDSSDNTVSRITLRNLGSRLYNYGVKCFQSYKIALHARSKNRFNKKKKKKSGELTVLKAIYIL